MRPGFINSFRPSNIAPAQATDPLWDYVVLDETMNGATPTTFTDTSDYARPTLVTNGTPRIWSPACSDGAAIFPRGWGSANTPQRSFLETTSPINLSSGDFTIEAWVNFPAPPQAADLQGYVLGQLLLENNQLSFGLRYNPSTSQWQFTYDVGAGNANITLSGGSAITVGTWYHVCAERSSGTLRLYVDGVVVASSAIAGSIYFNAARSLFVGGWNPDGTNLKLCGFASGVRITTAARYSGAFAPSCPVSGGSDPFWANTVLYMPFDTASGLTDVSTSARVFTMTGAVSVMTARCGSGALSTVNGDVDARRGSLNVPYPESRLALENKDFTIEAFVRLYTNVPAGYFPVILAQADTVGTGGAGVQEAFALFFDRDAGQLRFVFNRNGSADRTVASAAWAPVFGTWYHVAVSRSGGNLLLFIDGTLASTTAVTGSMFDSAQRMSVAAGGASNSANDTTWHGAIDGLRIYKDVAKYTSSFTPACPLPAPAPPAGVLDIVAQTGYGQVTYADFVDSGRTWRAMGLRHYTSSAARPFSVVQGMDAASVTRRQMRVAALGYGGGSNGFGGGGGGGRVTGEGSDSTLLGVLTGNSLTAQLSGGNFVFTTQGGAVTVQAGAGGTGGNSGAAGTAGGNSSISPVGALNAASNEAVRGAGGGGGGQSGGIGGAGGSGTTASGGGGGAGNGGGSGGGGGCGGLVPPSLNNGGDGTAGVNIGGNGGAGYPLSAFEQAIVTALQAQDATWSRMTSAVGGGAGGAGSGGNGAGTDGGGAGGGINNATSATRESSGAGPAGGSSAGTPGSAVLLLCWPLDP